MNLIIGNNPLFFHVISFLYFVRSIIMLVIEVQCCQNCERHNWCSRHNQAKYQQFSSLLQTRLQQFQPNLTYTQNHPPVHYSKKTLFSNLGFPVESYYDENKKQIAVFPRHGAFQIWVNGILIFSKLQSNVWPNVDRIMQVIGEMREDIENGDDIKKYSIDYRMNNLLEEKEKERNGGKEKRSVKFKISKRPKSNQFTANIFVNKGNREEIGQRNAQKNKTVELGSKPKVKAHRQSQVSKKSLIKLKIKKNQSAHSINNQQSTHSITNNQQIIKIEAQMPHFARRIEGNESALMLNKRLEQKKQILRQVKSQQLKSMANKGYIKLQKKSRKLVIQSNKGNNKKEQQMIMQKSGKVGQVDNSGQQILFFKTLLKPQLPQQKKQQSQYQQSVTNQGGFEANMIEVQDYQSQQQINNNQLGATMMAFGQYTEVKEQKCMKIDVIRIEDDNISVRFDVAMEVKHYWRGMVEQIIQSIKLKSIEPIKQSSQQIKEDQEQEFLSEAEDIQNQIQDIIDQKSIMPKKEEHQNLNECSEQQIKQIAQVPLTDLCELANKQCEILEEQQQQIKQTSNQITKNQHNTPTKEMKDDNKTQNPLQTNLLALSPLQFFQQVKTSNAIQQSISKENFTLDHMQLHDSSLNIQQFLIKQQSKHFSQELTNKILQNNRLLNEDQIKQMIQSLQQNSYNQFNPNEDLNNSEDNIGIAFQLTKEQGFFEGKRQSRSVKLQQLKRLQERNRQQQLQYSVYSEDARQKLMDGRESKVNSIKAIQNEGDKIEEGQYSNHTILEAQSSIVQPSYIVQAQGKAVQQQQMMNNLVQQRDPQEKLASSQQLVENPQKQQQNIINQEVGQIQQQKETKVQVNSSQLKIQTQMLPFNEKETQNLQKAEQKSIIPMRSQQKVMPSSKKIQKQNQAPSLKCLSSMQDGKNSQGERMLPNHTQTSISLSSQIRSQLSCLYYDIQARI